MRTRKVVIAVVVLVVVAGIAVYCIGLDHPDITRGDFTVSGDLAHGMVVDEYDGVGTLTYDGEGDVEWHLRDLTSSHYVLDEEGNTSLRGFDTIVKGDVLTLQEPG